MIVRKLLSSSKIICLVSLLLATYGQSIAQKKEKGFVNIFDGKTLTGWEGDPVYWRAEDGKIIGEVTPSTLLSRNSFLIWRGGIVKDFELKVLYKVSAEGNSGINYRSEEVEGLSHALRGYQADLEGADRYSGSNYEERRRTTLASRGQKVVLNTVYSKENSDSLKKYSKNNFWIAAKLKKEIGSLEALQAKIKKEDWNEYHLIVRGNRLRHFINGVLMSDVVDNDTVNRRFSGLLGVQVHIGPPMKIEYKDFKIKHL